MTFADHALLFVVALAANVLSSLAGGGTGLLQLPALLFLGLPFGVALATHKVATVALGLGATARHIQGRSLDWRFVALVLGAGLPGVVLGSVAILHIPADWAEFALGILTIGIGLYSMLQPNLGLKEEPKHRDSTGWLVSLPAVFCMGFLNGSLAAGTGLLVTLWLVGWFGLDYRRAVAHTLVLVGLLWNGTGALVLGTLGEIRWDWLPALLIGSLLGGYLGAHLSIVKGNKWVKRSFELVTLLVGLQLIVRGV